MKPLLRLLRPYTFNETSAFKKSAFLTVSILLSTNAMAEGLDDIVSFEPGTPALASEVNQNFQLLKEAAQAIESNAVFSCEDGSVVAGVDTEGAPICVETTGQNGQSITVVLEPIGANCPNGGVKVVDPEDGLALAIAYICDGSNGAQGPAGNNGSDGASGSQGIQGPTGNDGAAGSQGIQGPAGNDGSDGAAGGQGIQGPAGNDGSDGAAGAQGIQGPAGNDGSDGAAGTQGIQGPAGNDGSDGAAGTQGIQGPAGNDGSDGAAGTQGIQGPAGNDGSDGAAGGQGIQGPAGNDGSDGAAGSQGIQGPAGNDGSDGAAGGQGIQGPAGNDGFSLTVVFEPADVNCINGGLKVIVAGDPLELPIDYICDGNDGVDGAAGAQGIQGPAGNDGSDGAAGGQGIQGPAGNDGSDGAAGGQGIQGPAGNDGSDGAAGGQGIQGPAGNDGADGAAGGQGIQGPAGNDGSDGAAGGQGIQGLAGNDGSDGAAGGQGIQGPAGNDGADGAAGIQGDTGDSFLGALECDPGQMLTWNSVAWQCEDKISPKYSGGCTQASDVPIDPHFGGPIAGWQQLCGGSESGADPLVLAPINLDYKYNTAGYTYSSANFTIQISNFTGSDFADGVNSVFISDADFTLVESSTSISNYQIFLPTAPPTVTVNIFSTVPAAEKEAVDWFRGSAAPALRSLRITAIEDTLASSIDFDFSNCSAVSIHKTIMSSGDKLQNLMLSCSFDKVTPSSSERGVLWTWLNNTVLGTSVTQLLQVDYPSLFLTDYFGGAVISAYTFPVFNKKTPTVNLRDEITLQAWDPS